MAGSLRRLTEEPSLRAILVHLDTLPAEGQRFELSFSEAEVGAALAEAGWEGVGSAAPLTAEARVLPSGSEVFVLGRLATRVGYHCVRCLAPFSAPLAAEFSAVYSRQGGSGEPERELHAQDLEVEVLSEGTLDLARVVAEQLFLNLLPHPVCRAECLGLCPRCGADRNQEKCDCPEAPVSRPFAALEAWGKARRG